MTVQELIDQLSAVPHYYDVDLPVVADQTPEVNETKARNGKRMAITDADAAEILRGLQSWIAEELDWSE